MTATTMNNMTIKYFDTLDYVRKSKEISDPEALAEYQVKQIESAIETAVQYVQTNMEEKKKELATKSDLIQEISKVELKIAEIELKMSEFKYQTFRFIVGTGVGVIISLGGMIAHGFHWI